MPMRHLNAMATLLMMFFTLLILSFTGILEFPSASTSMDRSIDPEPKLSDPTSDPFSDILVAYKKWDFEVGCARFKENHKDSIWGNVSSGSLQEFGCGKLKMDHVKVLVKGWTWIPDNLENLYSCRCGMTCLWTKSSVLADSPDALLFETTTPPLQVIKLFDANFCLSMCFGKQLQIWMIGTDQITTLSVIIAQIGCYMLHSCS